MVKIEDYAEDSCVDADARDLREAAAVDPLPGSLHASLKEEEGQPSSSSSKLRSQFIGMGFSPKLVDKVLQRHGDDDSNTMMPFGSPSGNVIGNGIRSQGVRGWDH